MTQPPNQPPSGGFGPPQDPQQGGGQPPQMPAGPPPAGPPGQPPAGQPGYGYPQTAPGGYGQPQPGGYGQPQPGQQGGFGQPQQPGSFGAPTQPAQPGVYGAPTQPGQPGAYGQPQQGYGYPQQPGFGAPGSGGPGGGGGGFFKSKAAIVIAAAVAALLVAGGVVFAVAGGDDDEKKDESKKSKEPVPTHSAPVDPNKGGEEEEEEEDLNAGRKDGEAKVLWHKKAPKAPGSGADAPGMWITDKYAVKAVYKEVRSYNVADGGEGWKTLAFPAKICAATKTATDDGKVVIAYEDGKTKSPKCNQLQVIDLNTGAKGWHKPVEEGGLFDFTSQLNLAISGDTLVVGRSQSGLGYSISSGDKLWEKKKKDEGTCFPNAFTGGERVLVSMGCAASRPNEHEEIEEIDAKSGKTKWSKPFPKGWTVDKVYSTNPVVVYLTNKEKKQWNITTFKPNSADVQSEVSVDGPFAPECGMFSFSRSLDGCTGLASDADTLYLPTDATGGANEIVAINLKNGKEKWRTKAPADSSILPMKMDGKNLIAYLEPTYDGGGAVYSIPTDGNSHTPKKLLQNPEGTSEIENGFYSRAIDYVDGRFYISTTRLTRSTATKDEGKLILAYGN
ncbi:PQQ-binding-like beta-propeller repeat protein [Streptomyces sp. NA04227]|uniref:outer membrane protein assembly factor BamB family protein n=1 Tax=Streptomyces sp. NA04227 TaxID=2742136 RepID=UPI001591B5C1|nr:PQQ-binding-like beta-propeller repeat protein [Streptomyces sp. NA04227]QKW07073.1 PQQ-binding-like beta-propeller repeat protein [Streptomyces sp. NA04227]